MSSQQIIEVAEDEEIPQSTNKSALQQRRKLRQRSSSTFGISTCSVSSPTSIATTTLAPTRTKTKSTRAVTSTFLERANSEQLSLNASDAQTTSRRQRSHSTCNTVPIGANTVIHSEQFLAQHVTVVRSWPEFPRNETITNVSDLVASNDNALDNSPSSTPSSVDIDVHVVYGSVINHINLNKQKMMAQKSLPKARSRKLGVKLGSASENYVSTNVETEEQEVPQLPVKVVVSKKMNQSSQKLKAKEIVPVKGRKQKISQSNETHKKRVGGATRKKTAHGCRISRFTQTDHADMQPCWNFMDNKNCLIQSICPYMHSEFPCKYYYLGLECTQENCQFTHEQPLSEKQKESLRTYILKQMYKSSDYLLSDSDCNFLQQIRNKQDLWECLQHLNYHPEQSNKIFDDASIIEAKGQIDFLTPQQLRVGNDSGVVEMQEQTSFLSAQQLEYLKKNYKIQSNDELMHLSLGQLHQMGIIQLNEVSAPLPESMNVGETAVEQQSVQVGTVNDPPISTDIIEVYDDDDGDHILVIDEAYNETSVNLQSLSNDPSNCEQPEAEPSQQTEQTQAFECQDKVEQFYLKLKEANNVIDSIEESLQKLKTKTIPNKEKASELMAIFETLTQQEKIIEMNSISKVQATSEPFAESENMISTLPTSVPWSETENMVSKLPISETLPENMVSTLPTSEPLAESENMVPTLQTEECDALHFNTIINEDYFFLHQTDQRINTKNIDPKTEDPSGIDINNDKSMISEEILAPHEHLLVKAEEVGSIDVSVSDSVRSVNSSEKNTSGDVMQGGVAEKEDDSNIFSSVLNTDANEEVMSNFELEDNGVSNISAVDSSENKVVDEYRSNEIEAPLVKIDKTHEEHDIDDEDGPPYEKLIPSADKILKSSARKSRSRLRSNILHRNEEISSNTSNSQESDEPPSKTFKPRRLKIPKPKEIKTEKCYNEDESNLQSVSSLQTATDFPDGKVILSSRYLKKIKAKSLQHDINENVLSKSDIQKVDDSVESQMYVLCGEDDKEICNLVSKAHKELENNAYIPESASQLVEESGDNPIGLKVTTINQSKRKRLRSRNITTITKTVQRHVSYETPTITSKSSSSLSTEDIVSKCHRGQKCSNLTNMNDEKDFDNFDMQHQHKVMRMDSMNILTENAMECTAKDENSVKQCITYQNNVVFEDISTTDYYSSSDEKTPTQSTLRSSSPASSEHRNITMNEVKQQQKDTHLHTPTETISNKSDLRTEQKTKKIKRVCVISPTEEAKDIQKRLKAEKPETSNTFVEEHELQYGNQREQTVVLRSKNNKASFGGSFDNIGDSEDTADEANHEVHHNSGRKKVVVEYRSDAAKDENVEYKYSSLNSKLSGPDVAKRRIHFESPRINVTPIASPTYVCEGIASPSPVKGGGGMLVAAFEYPLGGEIDGRLTIPSIPYILHEIEVNTLNVNKPNNIDKLVKTSSLDPRIFRSDIKRVTTVIRQSQQASSSHYQTFSNPVPTSGTYPSISPYDPRNRSQIIAQQSSQPYNQNALACYNVNSAAAALQPLSPSTEVMQNIMTGQMNMMTPSAPVTFTPITPKQTPNMILYQCIQNSTWYARLSSTAKMQVNQSTTHLVTALNSFQRERCLNPAATFNIFKLDNAIEVLEIMNNLGVFVDDNGILHKQHHSPSYGERSCPTLGSTPPPCNATYSFIQQVLAPAAQYSSLSRGATGTCYGAHEPFVSCYLEQPRPSSKTVCCAHKHQPEEKTCSHEQQHSNDNYSDDSRSSQFRKPFNENQSEGGRGHNNQRFNTNNNSRYSKPPSSYTYGDNGEDSHSPTRSTSPYSQSYQSRGGGGGRGRGGGRGGRGGRFNNNYNNNRSSSPPSFSNSFNNNRNFNRNNSNKNSNYDNNNLSPIKARSPPNTSSSYSGGYQKSSSPPPPHKSSPPPLSPNRDRQQSPVLCSPARQQQKHASTDEECWD